jgi:parallel beta-helix repeat protein
LLFRDPGKEKGLFLNLRRKSRVRTLAIALLLTIFASFFVVVFVQNNFGAKGGVLASMDLLTVSIDPSGPAILQFNQSQILFANVSSQNFPLTYSWSISNSLSNPFINGTNYLLLTQDDQADFKFLTNDNDTCLLSVTAQSAEGAAYSTVALKCVTLPQAVQNQQTNIPQINQPLPTTIPAQRTNLNQASSQDSASTTINNRFLNVDLIVQNDAPNHYQVIKAENDNIIPSYSSNSANSTLNNAIAGGGTIAIMSGDYTGAQLIVPANTNIIASPDVTGIKYASIQNGAKIDEPDFNAAFGGYQSGVYTIATNATSSATLETLYLAFKPDNSVYYTSTNASYGLNEITRQGGDIFVKGNLTLTSPILLLRRATTLYSDGSGELRFRNVNGLFINASEVNVSNLCIRQENLGRTKTGITYLGSNSRPLGYETLSNLKLWGWNTALKLIYVTSSQVSNVDTTFSYTGLNIQGQSTNNDFSNCQFSNYGNNQTTVIIQRDDNLDLSPEGNTISHSLIFGGNKGIELNYSFASEISDSIIDGWTQKGVSILGRRDNSLSNNWIGCSSRADPSSIAVEVYSDSTNIRGNTLSAYNRSIYVYLSNNCLITANSLIGTALSDIYFKDNTGGSISNNVFSASSQTGITLQNSNNLSIYGNTFTTKGTSINATTSNHNSIVGNAINGTQQNGIIINGSSYNSITGNSINNSGQKANNTYSDIWLVNSSTYNNVCNNNIVALGTNKTAWGILENSLADDYNVYSGNIFAGQSSGAIDIKGANSLKGTNIPAIG